MDKEDVVYIYTYDRLYLSHKKKKEILPFVKTWVDLEGIMLSEIRQRQILYDFAYMWNLYNKTNEQT